VSRLQSRQAEYTNQIDLEPVDTEILLGPPA
jgi:hypothetical protein